MSGRSQGSRCGGKIPPGSHTTVTKGAGSFVDFLQTCVEVKSIKPGHINPRGGKKRKITIKPLVGNLLFSVQSDGAIQQIKTYLNKSSEQINSLAEKVRKFGEEKGFDIIERF